MNPNLRNGQRSNSFKDLIRSKLSLFQGLFQTFARANPNLKRREIRRRELQGLDDQGSVSDPTQLGQNVQPTFQAPQPVHLVPAPRNYFRRPKTDSSFGQSGNRGKISSSKPDINPKTKNPFRFPNARVHVWNVNPPVYNHPVARKLPPIGAARRKIGKEPLTPHGMPNRIRAVERRVREREGPSLPRMVRPEEQVQRRKTDRTILSRPIGAVSNRTRERVEERRKENLEISKEQNVERQMPRRIGSSIRRPEQRSRLPQMQRPERSTSLLKMQRPVNKEIEKKLEFPKISEEKRILQFPKQKEFNPTPALNVVKLAVKRNQQRRQFAAKSSSMGRVVKPLTFGNLPKKRTLPKLRRIA